MCLSLSMSLRIFVNPGPDLSLAILSAKYLPKVLVKLLMVVRSGSTIFGDLWRIFYGIP